MRDAANQAGFCVTSRYVFSLLRLVNSSVKVVTVLYFIIVEISIFLTFWIGYSPVFYNPLVSADWQATQIAALVFITLDFVVVLVLIVLSVCTQTATSLDTTRKVSGIAVIGLIVQLICLFVILGIFYIWQGVLEVVVPGFSTTQITTTIVNATTTATTIAATTTPAIGIPELVLRNVGQFVALGVWTSPGVLLVIRSREGGMLAQDVLWNIVSIITQVFNLIMAVFISLGSKAHIYAAAAIAVSFGCFYALDLILLFVLTFKLKAKEEVWDRSNEYLYNAPR